MHPLKRKEGSMRGNALIAMHQHSWGVGIGYLKNKMAGSFCFLFSTCYDGMMRFIGKVLLKCFHSDN